MTERGRNRKTLLYLCSSPEIEDKNSEVFFGLFEIFSYLDAAIPMKSGEGLVIIII